MKVMELVTQYRSSLMNVIYLSCIACLISSSAPPQLWAPDPPFLTTSFRPDLDTWRSCSRAAFDFGLSLWLTFPCDPAPKETLLYLMNISFHGSIGTGTVLTHAKTLDSKGSSTGGMMENTDTAMRLRLGHT